MDGQTWTVDVDGRSHTISVDHDSKTRRATVRVDGRITVKPLTGDETERELTVGSARYLVRRLENDTFDLDVPPEAFLDRAAEASGHPGRAAASRKTSEKQGPGRGIGLAIGLLVLLVVVMGLLRFGRHGFQYMRVPWQAYDPPDATFKAKFPAPPKEELESRNINGDIWRVTSLSSQYKNHYYSVEYLDLHMVITEANAKSIVDSFFESLLSEFSGTTVIKEQTTLSRNPAITFTVNIPAGVGPEEEKLKVPATMRGILALRNKRLFIVWTLAAQKDPFSSDLRQFLEAFELPPPPERKPQLIM